MPNSNRLCCTSKICEVVHQLLQHPVRVLTGMPLLFCVILPMQVLYNFVGNVEVLQPVAGQDFTFADERHIMLPSAAALYKLTEPACLLPLMLQQQEQQAHDEQQQRQLLRQQCVPEDPFGLTLDDAILAFMNCPHPLQTLGEVRAYGPAGSISRFHNPGNCSWLHQIETADDTCLTFQYAPPTCMLRSNTFAPRCLSTTDHYTRALKALC